ncbi:MAG: LuxR C-terminal-related transcriptional regulator [Proteobacteria bacterium]|nr:LuxR C-terminal-related transcriptional regulator [Pseudomonadota bacterium]
MDYTNKTIGQLLDYIADLEKRVDELEKYETEHKFLKEALQKIEEKYSNLFEKCQISIYRISPEGCSLNSNPAKASLEAYLLHEEMVDSISDIGTQLYARPEDSNEAMRKLLEEGFLSNFEVQFRGKDGVLRWGILNAIAVRDKNGNVIYYEGTRQDITERKLVNEAIKAMEQELAIKSKNLEELNIALRVLLKQMETDRKALEEKFVSNVKTLVLPYTEKIQKHRLDAEQKAYLDIMETNLKNVISPFLSMVSQFNFTPKEIEVVSLIRDKKSTKEIAEIMGVSPCAIDAHRNKIRKKIGLNNKKTNLQSYLQGLK